MTKPCKEYMYVYTEYIKIKCINFQAFLLLSYLSLCWQEKIIKHVFFSDTGAENAAIIAASVLLAGIFVVLVVLALMVIVRRKR